MKAHIDTSLVTKNSSEVNPVVQSTQVPSAAGGVSVSNLNFYPNHSSSSSSSSSSTSSSAAASNLNSKQAVQLSKSHLYILKRIGLGTKENIDLLVRNAEHAHKITEYLPEMYHYKIATQENFIHLIQNAPYANGLAYALLFLQWKIDELDAEQDHDANARYLELIKRGETEIGEFEDRTAFTQSIFYALAAHPKHAKLIAKAYVHMATPLKLGREQGLTELTPESFFKDSELLEETLLALQELHNTRDVFLGERIAQYEKLFNQQKIERANRDNEVQSALVKLGMFSGYVNSNEHKSNEQLKSNKNSLETIFSDVILSFVR